jgi:hypothetical protein
MCNYFLPRPLAIDTVKFMHRQARIDTAGGAVEYLGTRGLS